MRPISFAFGALVPAWYLNWEAFPTGFAAGVFAFGISQAVFNWLGKAGA